MAVGDDQEGICGIPRKTGRVGRRRGSRRRSRRRRVDYRQLRLPAPSQKDLEDASAALESLRAASAAAEAPQGEPQAEEPTETAWDQLLGRVLRGHSRSILDELGSGASFEAVHPTQKVKAAFLSALERREHDLTVSYHGTSARNIASISTRGLLVPGNNGNDIRVAHGSAEGVGVYTARIGSARLSRGFCDSGTMFVCAVCDTSQPVDAGAASDDLVSFAPSMHIVQTKFPKSSYSFQGKTFLAGRGRASNRRQVSRESREVRHAGDAVVVYEEGFVVPLFTVTLPPEQPPAQDAGTFVEEEEGPCWAPPGQIGRRRVVIPEAGRSQVRYGGGAERAGKAVWLPRAWPKEHATSRERRAKRRENGLALTRLRLAARRAREEELGQWASCLHCLDTGVWSL